MTTSTNQGGEMHPDLCPCCGYGADMFVRPDGGGHGEPYDRVGVHCLNPECGLELSRSSYAGHQVRERMVAMVKAWNRRAPGREGV